MRYSYLWLFPGSGSVVNRANAQNSLSPNREPDSTQLALPPAPSAEYDEEGEEAEVPATPRGVAKKSVAAPCCEKKLFRLTPRHAWDVNLDGTFLLPRFVSYYGNGYYYNYNGFYNGTALFPGAALAEAGSASLLVRRNVSTRKPGSFKVRKGAYRYNLRLGIGLSRTNPDTLTDPNGSLAAYGVITADYNTSIGGRYGYERQETVGRFQFVYGYELGAAHHWANTRLQTIYVQEVRREDTNFWNRSISGSVAAIGGVRFYLHSRVSVAIESRYQLYYGHSRWGGQYPQIYQNVVSRSVTGRTWRVGHNLMSLSALYIAFHLGKRVQVK